MPTVQKYGDRRQVATAALPGVRRTPQSAGTAESEGAGVAEARQRRALTIAGIGEEVAQLGQKLYAREQAAQREKAEDERQRAIRLQVTEGENQLSTWENEYYWNPQSGVMNRKGKESFTTPEESDAEFEKVSGEIAQTMGTPEAQAMFNDVRSRRRAANQLAVRRNVSNEMQAYNAQVTKARVENGVEEAVRANTSLTADGRLDVSAGRQRMLETIARFKDQAPALGLSPEEIEEQVEAITTRTHEGTIRILAANGNQRAANAYFEETQSEIDVDRHEDIKKVLKAGSVKKAAQASADKIISEGGSLHDQLAKARQIDDADERDEVESRIEHANVVRRQEQRQTHEDLMLSLSNKVRTTRSTASFTPAELAQLTPNEHENFRDYAKTLAGTNGAGPKTDPRVFYRLQQMAIENPKAFAERDLNQDLNGLSTSDHAEIVKLQMSVRRGDTKAANEALSGYMTQDQIVTNMMRSAGLDPTPPDGSEEAHALAQLRSAIDQQVQAWKADHPGKTISSEDLRKIGDDMLIDAVYQKGTGALRTLIPFTSGTYSDQKKRIGLFTIDDMSATDKTNAAEYLRAKGREVTPEAMVSVFRRLKALEARKPKP